MTFLRLGAAAVVAAVLAVAPAWAQRVGSALRYVETADGVRSYNTRTIVRWTHARLVFAKELERLAVGHESMLDVEILSPTEVLVLGRQVGRTSIIAWYRGGSSETFLFNVIPDLSALERALADVHPAIRLEAAPDRAAIILRGTVPDVSYSRTAEAAARSYLAAGISPIAVPQPVIQAGATGDAPAGAEPRSLPPAVPAAAVPTELAVINLIRVANLPSTIEDKVRDSISAIGGEGVRVTRIQKSDVPSDEHDALLLEGTVHSQVDLVRVVNVAAQLFLGAPAGGIEVLADESGGLLTGQDRNRDRMTSNAGSALLAGRGGSNAALFDHPLVNSIASNLGRAKLLSAAGGRILSVIEVADVPQVRVSVRVHEVNVSRLRSWRPEVSVVGGDFRPDSYPASPVRFQRNPAARIGQDSDFEIADVLQIVRGALTNQFQVGGDNFALDALFTLLEQEGISRRLSSPNLTVLSGEVARFHVGGEVPVPFTFSPAFGGTDPTTPGVFTGVDFLPFGVELSVRPLVDENDTITLDVRPVIVDLDTDLTNDIVASTGNPLATTAFRTRSLQTSARVQDAQALVVGGLVSRRSSDDKSYVPGLHRVPIIGWFSQALAKTQEDLELVVIVTPTIVRDPIERLEVWEWPGTFELLESSVAPPPPPVQGGYRPRER